MPIGMNKIKKLQIAFNPLFKKLKRKLIFDSMLRNEFISFAETCVDYNNLSVEERDKRWKTARKLFDEAIK